MNKKRWLLVGITCIIIGIVIEVSLKNYKSLAMIVPLLYLFNIWKTM